MIVFLLGVVLCVCSFIIGFLVGRIDGTPSKYRSFPIAPKRKTMKDIAQAIKGTPESVQIILPNPTKTAFDEGRVGSIGDIIV